MVLGRVPLVDGECLICATHRDVGPLVGVWVWRGPLVRSRRPGMSVPLNAPHVRSVPRPITGRAAVPLHFTRRDLLHDLNRRASPEPSYTTRRDVTSSPMARRSRVTTFISMYSCGIEALRTSWIGWMRDRGTVHQGGRGDHTDGPHRSQQPAQAHKSSFPPARTLGWLSSAVMAAGTKYSCKYRKRNVWSPLDRHGRG
jgi:hypothetical protein